MPMLPEQICEDIMKAAPAVIARVMLATRVEPGLGAGMSIAKRASIGVGSLACAIMVGDMAREFDSVRGYATALVIAAGFLAQDLATVLVARGRGYIRHFNAALQQPKEPKDQ